MNSAAAAAVKDYIDALIIGEWFSIAGYFVYRYAHYRKSISLALAAMSLGWAAAGFTPLADTFILDSVAVVLGLLVWATIFRVERSGGKR